jgi:TolA-binding protein
MDKLLLHTAISLNKKGKNADADVFFNAVVNAYPNSSSAKEAKKYIK